MQFAPKQEHIIDREHKNAGKSEDAVIGSALREQTRLTNGNGNQCNNCNEEPDSNVRNRGQIAQTDLDREPGRAPDDAERQPRRWYAPVNGLRRSPSSHKHSATLAVLG